MTVILELCFTGYGCVDAEVRIGSPRKKRDRVRDEQVMHFWALLIEQIFDCQPFFRWHPKNLGYIDKQMIVLYIIMSPYKNTTRLSYTHLPHSAVLSVTFLKAQFHL